MLRAMPSPSGNNSMKLYYIDRNPKGAYDELKPVDDALGLKVLEILREHLTPEEHAAVAEALGADSNAAMDNEGGPEPFRGMPQRGGSQYEQDRHRRPAMDAATVRSLAARFPHAASIIVSK